VVNLSIGYVFSPASSRIEYRQFKKAEIESVLWRRFAGIAEPVSQLD
jgi:hypothetical protein